MAQPTAAATVEAREAGYREALYAAAQPIDRKLVRRLEPSDLEAVRQLMESARPDAVVCANDRTAGRLMQTEFTAVPPGWTQPQPGWGQPTNQGPIPTWAQPPQGAAPLRSRASA